jgi:tetratricopeptide (TPR) repeat protein
VALTAPGAPLRRVLSFRLVSIYYAQLRFAEGEALRKELFKGRPEPAVVHDYFHYHRTQLGELVRKGDLEGALNMARDLADQRQKAFDEAAQALDKAEADVARARAEAQKNPSAASPALSQALRDSALARGRRSQGAVWLAQARSYLGEILHATGDLDAAAVAYEAALARFAEGYNGTWPGHTGTWEDRIRTRSALAILCRMRGDATRAQALQQQLLDELLPLFGEEHPDVKEARAELALLRKLQQG